MKRVFAMLLTFGMLSSLPIPQANTSTSIEFADVWEMTDETAPTLGVEPADTDDTEFPDEDIDYVDSESTVAMTMAIYSDSTYEQKVWPLVSADETLADWDYDTDRYLKIDVSGLDGGKEYQLVVTMQPILYINIGQDPTLANTEVTYIKNTGITVNGDQLTPLHTYSLENLTYRFNVGTTQQTVMLPIRYENSLWNKLGAADLGDGTTPLLTVSLQTTDGVDVLTPQSLLQVKTGVAMSNSRNNNLYDSNGNSHGSSISLASDEVTVYSGSQMVNSGYTEGHFYKAGDLVIKLTLPAQTIDGTEYVMNYSENFPVNLGSADYTTERVGNVVTFTFGNTFYSKAKSSSGNTFASFTLSFPDNEVLKNVAMPTDFTGGNVQIIAYGNTLTNFNFTVKLDNSEDPVFKQISDGGRANIYDLETVQYLGAYALGNTGGASDQVTVRLDFDTNATGAVGVTTVRVMTTALQKTITIKYTMMDENGNVILNEQSDDTMFEITIKNSKYNLNATSDANCNVLFTRADLTIEEHRNYYFKSLQYDIQTVREATNLTNTSARAGRSAGGTVWGYVLTPQTGTIQHAGMLCDQNGTQLLSSTFSTKIDAGTSPSYGIDTPSVSATSIAAGNAVTIKGRVYVVSYPYSSCSCLSDIRIGLLLPEGISVNEDTIKATFSNGKTLACDSVTKCETDEVGKYFWVIQFKSGEKIGYANERNGAIANGSALSFSVTLNTTNTVATQTLKLREIVFAAGKNRKNAASGSYSDVAVVDTYDLNGNLETNDKVACFNKNTTDSISITAAPAQLEITGTVRNKESGVSDLTAIMESYADSVVYDLNIRNTSGGSARDFFYLIPIKTTVTESNFMVKSEVPFVLTDIPQVITTAGTPFEIHYITSDAISGTVDYGTASLDTVVWQTDWSKVSLVQTLSATSIPISDIIMLKIVPKDDAEIVAGTDATISVPMDYEYEPMQYIKDAGSEVTWCSRGYYYYANGANTMAATISCEKTTVALQIKIYIHDDVVLTAAADHDTSKISYTMPLKDDENVPYTFEKSQYYSVGSIETTEVTLVTPSELANIKPSQANSHFSIGLTMNGDGVVNETTTPYLKQTGTAIGLVPKETTVDFIFTLGYYDAISDTSTKRSVHLILLGNNGVVIDLNIVINRELTPVAAGSSGVLADKHYSMFMVENSISITTKSAFSFQFSATLPFAQFDARRLCFTKPLPANVSITMVDWTNAETPRYYYYITKGNEQEIDLVQSFTHMGSQTKYVLPSEDEDDAETLLFILDMKDAVWGSAVGMEAGIYFVAKGKSSSTENYTDHQSETFAFTVSNERSFTIEETRVEGDTFTVSYTAPVADGYTDTYYRGNRSKEMALVIEAANQTTISPDANLIVGDKVYYLNSNGQFIVPLGNVGDGERSLRLVSPSMNGASLTVSLWVSATASEETPFAGEEKCSCSVTLSEATVPSFTVTKMSSRFLHRVDLSSAVTLMYRYVDADEITLCIQQKRGDTYVTVTNVLNMLDGDDEHTDGIFQVKQNDGSLSLKFSENMPISSYRILFTLTNENGTIVVPYNFIVTD